MEIYFAFFFPPAKDEETLPHCTQTVPNLFRDCQSPTPCPEASGSQLSNQNFAKEYNRTKEAHEHL